MKVVFSQLLIPSGCHVPGFCELVKIPLMADTAEAALDASAAG